MNNYIFVRHGQSQANLDKEYAGHSMTPLTCLGREQAKKTGELLKTRDISTIIVSDLERALSTAQIIAEKIGFSKDKIIMTPLCREIDAGEFSGTLHAPGLSVLEVGIKSEKGESLEQVETRVRECISYLQSIDSDGDILVVGHNSFYSCLFGTLAGEQDLIKYRKNWHMDNASIRELEF